MEEGKLILGDWKDFKGMAEPIRLLLEFMKIPYVEKHYGTNDKEEWQKEVNDKNFLFPNIPYINDQGKYISDTNTIVLYLCLKYSHPELLGRDDEQKVSLAMLKEVVDDLGMILSRVLYHPQGKEFFDQVYTERIEGVLEQFSEYLQDKRFLLGPIVWFDIWFFHVLNVLNKITPKVFETFPNLKAYFERIEGLEEISAYYKSDRFDPSKPILPELSPFKI
eukprot:TRINITY_DN408_c0_g1_i1.p1 TRINITY_DN408_c0_g1~~TRINITY_DN408_c0_g1_i1.p1  ORF type:complete len:221 (-),score=48.36 TRINITY_DN408_c0_g1_i1:131-793(-)